MKKYNNIDQKTDEWLHIRKGKITGTVLKSIMGTPKARQEAIYEILGERLSIGVESDYENAMERGNRLESEAIAMFELETGKVVERVGFCEDDTNSLISNSPDGLIVDTVDTEAVEAKCMGSKNHVKLWLTNEIPDEYEWQVVQYFIVNQKLKKLYFIGYNTDIPAHPLHIIEVTREEIESKIKEGREKQEKFLQEVDAILETIIKI